ncbi:MAG: pilus assembly protein TadG-related protein [Pseudomonadota bacterium]
MAILAALTLAVLLLAAGLAMDLGRTVVADTRLSGALDAAALAGAKGLRLQNLSDVEVQRLTRSVFNANMQGNKGATKLYDHGLRVTVDRKNVKVKIDVDAHVPTVLSKVFGIREYNLARSATAVYNNQNIEVAIQLDITGSMCNPCTKLTALQDATNLLVDTLLPDDPTGQRVRVGIVPFSSGVDAGRYAPFIVGRFTGWGSCIGERLDDAKYQLTDVVPAGEASLRPLWQGFCPPSAEVIPLTDDKGALKANITGYVPSGPTAGHLGTAWAWYLLSPKWAAVWPSASEPADYSDKTTVKVAVLMTDGNYNTYWGSGHGKNSTNVAKLTCANMKSAGIRIYTVGFDISGSNWADKAARDVMASCASSAANAYLADDPSMLIKAFQDIAVDITQLRIAE